MNDLWLIGDSFLHSIYHALQKIRMQADIAKKEHLYIHNYFNVTCYTPNPNSMLRNIMTRFANTLIKASNDTLKLPRFIVVIPDDNIMKPLRYKKEDFKELVHESLSWIIRQMFRTIKAKKDFLRRRKPGVILAGEPKTVWVKMIDRINGRSKALAMRNKYNLELEKALDGKEQHYILDVSAEMEEPGFFDQFNQLNDFGKTNYWIEIDKQLELFDKHRILLKPSVPMPPTTTDDTEDKRRVIEREP